MFDRLRALQAIESAIDGAILSVGVAQDHLQLS